MNGCGSSCDAHRFSHSNARGREAIAFFLHSIIEGCLYLLESGWRQWQRHCRLFHSSCCDEKMVMAMRHQLSRYKYASMRMQTQGSRRLSSEATTLLIFQPFASLHHQNQSALLVAWKTSFCYVRCCGFHNNNTEPDDLIGG